ncbi:MAG: SDR family NAD(P)-dependent oxidoreductase [Rhodobacteraceae bacterium]|nr:SDR family NAD(P)-dependent oxidoreductase [Paracoccaceae bacterium]
MNRIDLDGKNAVVTGGAQGIGFAIAGRLLGSGASVAIWDIDAGHSRTAVDRLSPLGNVFAETVDVSDWDSVARTAAATASKFAGRIDILCANAGVAGRNAPLADMDPAEWRRVIDIDLNSVFYCLKAIAPIMIGNGYGRIVNTASVAGKDGNPNAAHYSAAKAGVIALTKSLGKELAGHDIAVNCITPAVARTGILEQVDAEFVEYMLSKIPRGRFVKVEEIANMVAWLVSAENSFTTGAVFDLSGGRSTY